MNNAPVPYRTLLIHYLRPQRGAVVGLALLLCANITFQLINPQVMRQFLDHALGGGALNGLTTLAVIYMAVALIQQIVAVGATYLGENVAWVATNLLRYDLARHCLHLDMAFHNQHTPGEMIERIDGDINALSQFFSQFVLQILSNGLLLLGILVLLFREATGVGLALTLFVVVTLLILNALRDAAVPAWKAARAASADYFGFVEERLAGMEDIRANGAKPYVMSRFFQMLRAFWQTNVRARLLGFTLINTAWVLFSIGTAVAFVLGAWRYQAGAMTLGGVYLIVHYTGMLSMPMQRILQEVEKLQQAGAGLVRIQELLAVQSTIEQPTRPDRLHLPAGPLAVRFADVSFTYTTPTTDADLPGYVLDNLSFDVAPGQVLGLLGRTGSGKTTITRLLTRLYDPQTGQVRLGGLDVGKLHPAEVRRRVGVVTQQVQLFHATVRDNLTFFDANHADARIVQILEELGLGRWYAALDQGLDTVLAADGGGLSAGEAQLLAFARIFLKNPGLVILDEASSRLDPATEHLIERAVDRLLSGADGARTAIIIAHRLATVQRADTILILENGRILEQGSRQGLAADPTSQFSQLLQTGLAEVLA
jgi:ABC-type multidrug transport system fused ATPase/permease subunit